jgi:hypothetical protein
VENPREFLQFRADFTASAPLVEGGVGASRSDATKLVPRLVGNSHDREIFLDEPLQSSAHRR